MRPVPSSPICAQVSPASVDFQTPFPRETLDRIDVSPVPTHTMAGSDDETARAPIACTGWSSKTGFQWMPASSVFQTPPVAAPA